MKILYITCNPYSENPFPKIQFDSGDGKKKSLSSLATAELEPLSESLIAHDDWAGLFPTINKALGISQVKLVFKGCIEDYQMLKQVADLCNALTVELVTNEMFAEKNSPVKRKEILFERLNSGNFKYELLNGNALSETLTTCQKILEEDISSVEAVVKSKATLDKYFLEHFTDDEKFLEQTLLKLKAETAIEDIPEDLFLPIVKSLKEFLQELINTMSEMINHNMNLNWIMLTISNGILPPKFDYVAETEINSVKGEWLEESDATILRENFLKKVSTYCTATGDAVARVWLKILNSTRDDFEYLYKNEYYGYCSYHWKHDMHLLKDFKRIHPDINTDLEVKLVTVTEEYDKPSYWSGNSAQRIVKKYVDIGKYECGALNLASEKISEGMRCWQRNLRGLFYGWESHIEQYVEKFSHTLELTELQKQLNELRLFTEQLTLLDWEEQNE